MKLKKINAVLTVATALSIVAFNQAYAAKKVSTPYVHEGEIEFELQSGYKFDDNKNVDGAQKHKIAMAYGVNKYWKTEIEGIIEKDGTSGSDFVFEAIELQNTFQLTEQGEYFVDVGAALAYEIALTSGHSDAAEAKILLGKDIGKFTNYANIIYKRQIGENSNDENEVELRWSTRYRYNESFSPGFEIYSELGELGDAKVMMSNHIRLALLSMVI